MTDKKIENNLEEVPLQHYIDLFSAADPQEISARTGAEWNGSCFRVKLLDTLYQITWPEYSISAGEGSGVALRQLPVQTFLLRFLLEGKRAEAFSDYRTFQELPWGNVYIQPYTGRCIKRAAFTFNGRLPGFRSAVKKLGGTAMKHGDASGLLELLPGYMMELIVWEGDDEFPPNSQILYSSNFAEGFSAEDRVKAGDILITAIKCMM